MGKCKFPDGITVKPDGVNELDPCIYKDVKIITNATVTISRCVNCGNYEIMWQKSEDSEVIYLDPEEEERDNSGKI